MIKNRQIFLTLFVIFCFLYVLRLSSISYSELKPNQSYFLQGRVSSIKNISDKKVLLKLGRFHLFLTNIEKFPHFQRGDILGVTGRLEKRVTNIFYHQLWLIEPDIKQIAPLDSSSFSFKVIYYQFLREIDVFRVRLEEIFLRTLPDKEASLLAGIVLGSQKDLPFSFYHALRQSGTLHLVVASGMNVTILGKVVLDIFLKRFRRGTAVLASLLCILIYTFLAGGEVPIVRAAIMGSLAFSAQVFGRQYWAGWALFLTLSLMLLIFPDLLFQVGFQLSAAATAGLIFLSPQVSRLFKTRLLGLVEADLTETVSAQAAVMPLLLAHFGQFNFLSVFPNVLVAALVPLLMRLGGILLITGVVSQALAQVIAWLVWVPLRYMVLVIEFFGQMSWLILEWTWPWWLVFGYWTSLALLSAFADKPVDECDTADTLRSPASPARSAARRAGRLGEGG